MAKGICASEKANNPNSTAPRASADARSKREELGLPASVELSARALGLMVMTFLIASFGTLTIAAYGVGSNILQVVMVPAMGLSMAISTLVGQNIGAGNIERGAQIGRLGALLGFASLSFFGIVVFLFAPQLVAFFVPEDPAVIGAGAGSSREGLRAGDAERGGARGHVRFDLRLFCFYLCPSTRNFFPGERKFAANIEGIRVLAPEDALCGLEGLREGGRRLG